MKNNHFKSAFLNTLLAFMYFLTAGITTTYAQPSSQTKDITDKPDLWYQIELIVFEYTNTRNAETENWPQQPGLPEKDLTLELMDSRTMLEADWFPEAFQMLDQGELQLTTEYNLIRNSRQRRPLLHIGWRQPTHSKNESIPVRIRGHKAYSIQPESAEDETINLGSFLGDFLGQKEEMDKPEDQGIELNIETLNQIEGTITLSRARYLHVWTDLIYRIPSEDLIVDTLSAESSDVDSTNVDPVNTFEQPLVSFRLQEHRRMRSKEIHYIDHPLFGVIVLATPFELPEPPEELPESQNESSTATPSTQEGMEGKDQSTPVADI
jgi:hypothetical protein